MSEQDMHYYRERARTEMDMAQRARNTEARKVHDALARHYRALADEHAPSPPAAVILARRS